MRSTMRPKHRTAAALAALALLLPLHCHATAAEPAESDYNLGVQAYRSKDYAAARVHWAKAVQQDDLSASNNLAFLLYNGLGGDDDAAGAIVLWRRAAERGHSESQWHLGEALERGRGAPRDALAAYGWYRCATAPRIKPPAEDDAELRETVAKDASQSLVRLIASIEPGQLEAAERQARAWITRYVP